MPLWFSLYPSLDLSHFQPQHVSLSHTLSLFVSLSTSLSLLYSFFCSASLLISLSVCISFSFSLSRSTPTVHWLAWGLVFGELDGNPLGRSVWGGLAWVGLCEVGMGWVGLWCRGVGCVVFDWICRHQCNYLFWWHTLLTSARLHAYAQSWLDR